jgi:hypothetical protein
MTGGMNHTAVNLVHVLNLARLIAMPECGLKLNLTVCCT